eukprot:1186216-Prorocentrum_minimum.AAC.2
MTSTYAAIASTYTAITSTYAAITSTSVLCTARLGLGLGFGLGLGIEPVLNRLLVALGERGLLVAFEEDVELADPLLLSVALPLDEILPRRLVRALHA